VVSPVRVRVSPSRKGLHKPTVRRILALLTHGGYVERLPDDPYRKRYRLTLRAQVLGHEMATAAGFAAA